MTEREKRKKGIFTKELRHMMYGFGDDINPLPETVDLMEEILIEYIQQTAREARLISTNTKNKISVEDLKFVIRKDKKKYARAVELLAMNEELKQARKAFDANHYTVASSF